MPAQQVWDHSLASEQFGNSLTLVFCCFIIVNIIKQIFMQCTIKKSLMRSIHCVEHIMWPYWSLVNSVKALGARKSLFILIAITRHCQLVSERRSSSAALCQLKDVSSDRPTSSMQTDVLLLIAITSHCPALLWLTGPPTVSWSLNEGRRQLRSANSSTCCQTDLQQLCRQMFCCCSSKTVEQSSSSSETKRH